MPINLSVEYPKLELEVIKLKMLLHDLTPGGSEFYDNPEYCAEWVKKQRQESHYTMANIIKELKERNKALYDALQNLCDKVEKLALWDKTDSAYYNAKKALTENK